MLLHYISTSFWKKGDVIKIDTYTFNILSPQIDVNENDNSLVIYTNINNEKFLFTGDISSKIEKRIISEYPNLKVDILKVGHHGSITSTSEELLDRIKPTYGIIEVGLNNHFNHPSEVVLDRLKKRAITTLQTSIMGSIKMIIDVNNVTIISALT